MKHALRNPEIAAMVAHDFHRRNPAIEYETLEQEALEAVWRSETGGRYDPRVASLRTFSTTCARRQLLTIAQREGRRAIPTVSLDMRRGGEKMDGLSIAETLADESPDPEHVAMFRELLRQLPEDARTVVRLALEEAGSLGGLAPRRARAVIAEALGWGADRLREAFSSIESALADA